MRRCIVTRESQPRAGLIRFVVGPDDAVTPDIAERLPGRGMWVSADRAALRRATSKGLFARAAKRAVRAAPDLPEAVDALLARSVVDRIAMARKAGQAVMGYEKTRAALVSGDAAVLIQAADGSLRERARLRAPGEDDSLVDCLTGWELGLAFGRDNVIHAAVLAGGLGDRIRKDALRLRSLRAEGVGLPADGSAGAQTAGEGSRGKG